MPQTRHVVAIIGSTLFHDAHLECARVEELKGHVPLLSCAWMKSKDTPPELLDPRLTETARWLLDELIDARIDMADEVLVVNVGGYVGDSTRQHIDYARLAGKPIRYLE